MNGTLTACRVGTLNPSSSGCGRHHLLARIRVANHPRDAKPPKTKRLTHQFQSFARRLINGQAFPKLTGVSTIFAMSLENLLPLGKALFGGL